MLLRWIAKISYLTVEPNICRNFIYKLNLCTKMSFALRYIPWDEYYVENEVHLHHPLSQRCRIRNLPTIACVVWILQYKIDRFHGHVLFINASVYRDFDVIFPRLPRMNRINAEFNAVEYLIRIIPFVLLHGESNYVKLYEIM